MIARSRQMLVEAKTRIELTERLVPLRRRLDALAQIEIKGVEWLWRGTQVRGVARVATTISWLGNGLIYVILGLALLASVRDAWWPALLGGLSMAMAHALYPWIKAACARERPCAYRLSLAPLLDTLDRHSFPSGHVMTLTAALLPVLIIYPALWPAAAIIWVAMAWSRIATAHHYPSDVAAGALLGAGVASPLVWVCLA